MPWPCAGNPWPGGAMPGMPMGGMPRIMRAPGGYMGGMCIGVDGGYSA